MKYSLSGRQPHKNLTKANEIRIAMRDFQAIPEYIEKYPSKAIILEFEELPKGFTWELMQSYSEKANGNLYCALNRIDFIPECTKRKLKYYYRYPVTSLYELHTLAQYKVSYIVVGSSLMANLPFVANYKIPLRVYPNLAYEPYMKRKDGVIGGWIRPEDTKYYEGYVAVFDFYAPNDLEKEATLFHVYAEEGRWNGNLKYLIDNLDVDFDNRLLYDKENFANRRMSCKYKCLEGRHCDYCDTQIKHIDQLIRSYKEYKDEKLSNSEGTETT